jgi:hypothetical protein
MTQDFAAKANFAIKKSLLNRDLHELKILVALFFLLVSFFGDKWRAFFARFFFTSFCFS